MKKILKKIEDKIFAYTKAWSLAKKIGVVGGCWVLFLIIIYFIVVAGEHRKFINVKAGEQELAAKLQQQQKQIPRLLLEQKKFLQLQKTYAKYNNLLGSKIKIASLLRYLADSAKQQNVVLQNIQPQPAIKKAWLIEYPIQITVLGNYSQITSFMHKILNGEYFIVLDDFKLTADKSFKQLTLQTTIVFSQNNE
jgi:type IV pilus assembly protein PilO